MTLDIAALRKLHNHKYQHDCNVLAITCALHAALDEVERLQQEECRDRNHEGLDRVMCGARLPDATLGQDAGYLAFALGEEERLRARIAKLREALEELVHHSPFVPDGGGVKVWIRLDQIAKARAALREE